MLPSKNFKDDGFYLANPTVPSFTPKPQGANNKMQPSGLQNIYQQHMNAQYNGQPDLAYNVQGMYIPRSSKQYIGVQNNIYIQQNRNQQNQSGLHLGYQSTNKNANYTQNMSKNFQGTQGLQDYYKAQATPLLSNTNQQRYQNQQMNVAHQMKQPIDEQHMFNTLMQNVNTRKRLIEMYQELMEQHHNTMPAQNNVQTAQLVDIQNSQKTQLQVQQVLNPPNPKTNNVVPFEQSVDSMEGTTYFHLFYQIKKKIGEGGQGSVYSGKQRLY